MGMKFGSADKWFGYGLTLFAAGTGGGLAGSWLTPELEPLPTILRAVAITAIPLGVAVIIAGVFVWRYNLGQEATTPVIIAGAASPEEERREALTTKRAEHEVELASLRPYTSNATTAVSIFSLGTPTLDELAARSAYERARAKETQIKAEIAAIDRELLSMLRDRKKDAS